MSALSSRVPTPAHVQGRGEVELESGRGRRTCGFVCHAREFYRIIDCTSAVSAFLLVGVNTGIKNIEQKLYIQLESPPQ